MKESPNVKGPRCTGTNCRYPTVLHCRHDGIVLGAIFLPQSDQNQSVETLKVNVNVVQLFFNVKDKHGLLIPDQTKDDFEVLEEIPR